MTSSPLSVKEDPASGSEKQEDIQSLLSRLNIEKRIQFGAEKFLEALDSETSSIPQEARPDLRSKVKAELAASKIKIRNLDQAIIRADNSDGLGDSAQRSEKSGDASNELPERDLSAHHLITPIFKTLRHETSRSTMASATSDLSRRTSERSGGGSKSLSRSAREAQLESTGRGNQSDPALSSNLPSTHDAPSPLHRDESHWSLVSTSYGGGSQSGFSERRNETGRDVTYEERMDPSVTIELVHKARQSLEQLVHLRQKETSSSISIREVGPHIANLTRFARLSPSVIDNIDFVKLVEATFCYALEPNLSPLKAACYRLYRNFMLDRKEWACLEARGMEWLLIRSFAKASRQIPEMEQAILLIRAIISLPQPRPDHPGEGYVHSAIGATRMHTDAPAISQALVRVLVSMAENSEDPFQAITLETLTELALIDLDALLLADGWRFILQIYEYGPYQLTQALTPALISLLDKPSTRDLLTPDTGLGAIFSGFTNAYGSGPTHLQRLGSTSINVLEVLRSWSGLTLCCMDELCHIRALVDALRVPVVDTREALVDTFFQLFQFELPTWYNGIFSSKIGFESDEPRRRKTSVSHSKIHLADQYTALLLAVFLEAGILEALVDIVEEQVPSLSQKSIQLISDILASAARLLPLKYATRVQTLPRLFECAASLDDPHARVPALDALSTITRSTRHQTRVPVPTSGPIRKRSNSQTDPVERGQRQVDQVRRRLGMQMDDRQFQSALVDSQVLYTKDHTKWNYDILMDIIEGPLLTTRRLEEAFRVSKFGRRLMTFFQPLYRRFSDIKKTRLNRKWIKIGTTLMSSLLATADGVMILAEDQLLRQIVDCFMELDQYAGHPNPQPYFSRNRMENTLSCGYFDMIHVLSKNTEGIKLLEQFNFFTCFYHLSELRSRDDLSRAIIGHLDYSSDGHARIILSKALTSSYMHTRLYATQRLGRLLEEENAAAWTLELLVTQLYDPAFEVCEAAAHYLEAACEELHVLEAVVDLRPTLDHLGDVGQCLLMRFLSTAAGFSYLRRADYIDREIDEWYCNRNMQYVSQIELYISNHMRGRFADDTGQQFSDVVPPNFYGEIAKTTEGCHVLAEKGHVASFARIARDHSADIEDESKILQLKSVLWALGNIGSSEGGLPFLEQEDIIEHIIDLAEHAAVLSIRGTCFFVLGLVASTTEGCDILEEYGWVPTVSSRGNLTGLCLPEDLSDFLHLDLQPVTSINPPVKPVQRLSGQEAKLLQDVSNLGNYVLATQAMQSLARLRNRHRQLFGSVPLYIRVMRMLSDEHYKQPVRAFVLDMFDLQLDVATLAAMNNFVREGETSDPAPQRRDSGLPERSSDPAGELDITDRNKLAATTDSREQSRINASPRMRVEGFEEPRIIRDERL